MPDSAASPLWHASTQLQAFAVECLQECKPELAAYIAPRCLMELVDVPCYNGTNYPANGSNCSFPDDFAPLSPMVHADNVTVVFSANLTHLRPGEDYRLCVDLDGAGPLRVGDSTLSLYASAMVAAEPVLLRLPDQVHQVVCSSRCSMLSYASLDRDLSCISQHVLFWYILRYVFGWMYVRVGYDGCCGGCCGGHNCRAQLLTCGGLPRL